MRDKIRYTKQLMLNDCGPAALVNTLKWAGKRISYRNCRHKIYKKLKFDPEEGTDSENIPKALLETKMFQIKVKRYISYKDIINNLDENHSILLTFLHSEGYHIVLLIGFTKKSIKTVNWFGDRNLKAVQLISNKIIKNILKNYNIAFLIKK